jgi:hypothetical protein
MRCTLWNAALLYGITSRNFRGVPNAGHSRSCTLGWWCARSIRGRVVRHRPHGPLATLRLQGGKRGGLQSDGKDCSDWGLLMDAQVTVREFRELTQRLRF